MIRKIRLKEVILEKVLCVFLSDVPELAWRACQAGVNLLSCFVLWSVLNSAGNGRFSHRMQATDFVAEAELFC